jgi:protein tyrosine phosphatase (PTP) superfamily phosphohydrolase (DUF442 family)
VIGFQIIRVGFGDNIHTVIAGRVYRSAQLEPNRLARIIQDRGIRTVVNLRGQSFPQDWYVAESRTTHRLGVSQEDITLSAMRYPSIIELRRFVQVLDHTEYPILLHCRQGADRTGLASAIVRLLRSDSTLDQAKSELSLRYGHVAVGPTTRLDAFLSLYENWLNARHVTHSSVRFRNWLTAPETPGDCSAKLELLSKPPRLKVGEPSAFRLRATNTGALAWHFTPENNVGHHIGYYVLDGMNRAQGLGRSGLFHADVEPGGHIDLILPLPSPKSPGRFWLMADMIDEQHCFFHQAGSEPLEVALDVHN